MFFKVESFESIGRIIVSLQEALVCHEWLSQYIQTYIIHDFIKRAFSYNFIIAAIFAYYTNYRYKTYACIQAHTWSKYKPIFI